MVKVAPPSFVFISAEAAVEQVAEACSRPEPISEALSLKFSAGPFRIDIFDAVYVIAPDDLPVSKVGIARNPRSRLDGLRCGNWNALSLRALFWCADDAAGLEAAVLRKCKDMGAHMRGEWAALEPSDMALLIASCAKAGGWRIADSEIYLRSWIPCATHRAVEAKNGANRRAAAVESHNPDLDRYLQSR